AGDGVETGVVESLEPCLLCPDEPVLAGLEAREIEAPFADVDAEVSRNGEVVEQFGSRHVLLRRLAGHVGALPSPPLPLHQRDSRTVVAYRVCSGLARGRAGAQDNQIEGRSSHGRTSSSRSISAQ